MIESQKADMLASPATNLPSRIDARLAPMRAPAAAAERSRVADRAASGREMPARMGRAALD
jgi:hypothetical protein